MTRPTYEPTIPSDQDALLARTALKAFDEHGSAGAALKVQIVETGDSPTILDLPAAAATVLRAVLKEMAEGRAVTVVPIEAEITTGEAAELLHVSRPFVVGLIDKGLLPARMAGAHRRIRLEDVLAYKHASKAKARKALHQMVAISQALGLE